MGRPHRVINAIRGKRLKELIDDQCMTQKEFEKEINLSQQVISNIINGHAHLTDERAKEIIAKYPQYNLSWLLGLVGPKYGSDAHQRIIDTLNKMASHQKRLFSDVLRLVSDFGYSVKLENELVITRDKDNKTIVLTKKEALDYYDEIYNMVKNYVEYHFDKRS